MHREQKNTENNYTLYIRWNDLIGDDCCWFLYRQNKTKWVLYKTRGRRAIAQHRSQTSQNKKLLRREIALPDKHRENQKKIENILNSTYDAMIGDCDWLSVLFWWWLWLVLAMAMYVMHDAWYCIVCWFLVWCWIVRLMISMITMTISFWAFRKCRKDVWCIMRSWRRSLKRTHSTLLKLQMFFEVNFDHCWTIQF